MVHACSRWIPSTREMWWTRLRLGKHSTQLLLKYDSKCVLAPLLQGNCYANVLEGILDLKVLCSGIVLC